MATANSPSSRPRVFLSYAWESEAYRERVKALAERLRDDGVDARLDQWHLPTNGNILEFMNHEVRKADWVLVLCSPGYQQRVRATEDGERVAGVGWETRLLASAILVANRNKVLAVLTRGEWLDAAPDSLLGQRYFDLSRPDVFEQGYSELRAAILGRQEQAPPLGPLPIEVPGPSVSAPGRFRPPRTKPNHGSMVPRMCDRDTQETQFLRFFWENMRNQIPQVYLLCGDELECHDSFVKRLYETRVKRLAEEDAGPQHATTECVQVDWPEQGTLAIRRRDLQMALFRGFDDGYERRCGVFSSEALCELLHKRGIRLAMIHHPVRASAWDAVTSGLLHWYSSFWSESMRFTSRPQFVVVIDVLYPRRMGAARSPVGRLVHWWRGTTMRKRVQTDWKMLESASACFVCALDELRCVAVDDVVAWFRRNRIFDSDKQRYETAQRLFQTRDGPAAACRNMCDIEPELCRIHAELDSPERSVSW